MATGPFTPGYGEFQGIPQRTLPDDCVEYTLLIIDHISPAQDPASVRSQLEKVQQAASGLVKEVAGEYIWQRDGFQLELIECAAQDWWWCLQGRTEYGDSVDDEWLIVWILRELSKRFEKLWIRVYDTDGEFLLIEAANTLPRWLNPEIADNRVWINSGNLLIIPLSIAPPPTGLSSPTKAISRPLELKEAYSTISIGSRDILQRIRLVEEEAFYRLSRYPQAIRGHLHHGIVRVPRKVSMVLREIPESIASAVEAFYLRDPISLRALKPMKNFPLKDTVVMSVKFTKVLYAQLKSQEFEPPEENGYRIPISGSKDLNEADIGMKIACGFEMLICDEAAPQISSPSRKKVVEKVKEILRVGNPPTDEMIAEWDKQVDSEDWLDINYQEFDRNLQGQSGGPAGSQRTGRAKKQESGWGDKQAEDTLKKMVERFEAFLNDEAAGAEGAEFLDDMDIDDDDEEESSEEEDPEAEAEDSGGEDKEISFDEAEFSKMMREMMGMPAENADESVENEEEEVRKVMARVQEELEEAGVIEREDGSLKIQTFLGEDAKADNSSGDDEVNIDYALAKNMLESFKGQGGLSGPGGNLMSRMGIALPRDDSEDIGGRH